MKRTFLLLLTVFMSLTAVYGMSAASFSAVASSKPVTASVRAVTKAPAATALKSVKNVSTGVTVSWKAASRASGYYVYRKAGSATKWSKIATVKSGNTSFTDKNVKSGTNYKYTVKAYNKKGNGGYNSKGIAIKYLAQPTVKLKNISGAVVVSWNKITGSNSYYVYRKLNKSDSWSKIATIGKNSVVSYTDKKVTGGKSYIYTVKAVNGKTVSSYVSGVSIIYLAQPKVSAKNTADGITLSWGKITGAKGYIIYRKLNTSDNWSRIATISASYIKYIDSSVISGNSYIYTVKAYNGKYNSSYVSGVSLKYLLEPRILAQVTSEGINVLWSRSPGAQGYYLYRKTSPSASWSRISIISNSLMIQYIDTDVTNGSTYIYMVKAYYGTTYSSYSSSVSIEYIGTATPDESMPKTASEIVKCYKAALSNAQLNAKSATLISDGAVNYNSIFEAGSLTSVASTLVSNYMKVEQKNQIISAAELPGTPANIYVSNVRTASCVDKGTYFELAITMKDELNPTAGRGIGSVVDIITEDQIAGSVSSVPGIALSNISFSYYGAEKASGALQNGNVLCRIDKATGNMTYLKTDAPCVLEFDAKVSMTSIQNARIGIETVAEYSISYSGDVPNTWNKEKCFNYYKDAVLNIKDNAAAGHTRKEWQAVNEFNTGGSSALLSIIDSYIITEEQAEAVVSAKGSSEAKARMCPCDASLSNVLSATKKESGNNYTITIVMKDEVNPTKGSDGIASMSTGILYLEDVRDAIKNDTTVSCLFKSIDDSSKITYQSYTIVATITKDGRLVDVSHSTTGVIDAGAKLVFGSTVITGEIDFFSHWYDFVY